MSGDVPVAQPSRTLPGGGGLLAIFVTTSFMAPMAAISLLGVAWGSWPPWPVLVVAAGAVAAAVAGLFSTRWYRTASVAILLSVVVAVVMAHDAGG